MPKRQWALTPVPSAGSGAAENVIWGVAETSSSPDESTLSPCDHRLPGTALLYNSKIKGYKWQHPKKLGLWKVWVYV